MWELLRIRDFTDKIFIELCSFENLHSFLNKNKFSIKRKK